MLIVNNKREGVFSMKMCINNIKMEKYIFIIKREVLFLKKKNE